MNKFVGIWNQFITFRTIPTKANLKIKLKITYSSNASPVYHVNPASKQNKTKQKNQRKSIRVHSDNRSIRSRHTTLYTISVVKSFVMYFARQMHKFASRRRRRIDLILNHLYARITSKVSMQTLKRKWNCDFFSNLISEIF